jgi:hypothetical protein
MDNTPQPNRRTVLAAMAVAGTFGLDASAVSGNAAPAEGENAIRPFRVNISEEQLAELRRRIAATRWPDRESVNDQSQGIQLAKIKPLVEYWGNEYDWRRAEAKLNGFP